MPNSSPLGTEKPQEGQDFRQRLEPASVRKAKLSRLRQDALKTDQEFAQEERAADQEPPADTMETIPIIVKRTETAVDSLSQTERRKDRSFPLQTIRTVVTWGFGFWQTVGRSVTRRVGWTPRVAPYVGYGTTKYVRLICRTVLGMKHLAPADTVSLGIRNMLMLPAPRTLVRMKIDDAPVHTAQIGSSELFNPLDGSADLGSNSIVSDAHGYLDLIAKRELTPGEHVASYKVRGRKAVQAPVYIYPADTRVGIISDVDDTILVSQVPSLLKAVYNFFLVSPHSRASVPGMAVFYTKLKELFPRAPFFYLSTSPWNVETTIRSFISRFGFPDGPLLLRDFDPRPKTFIPGGVQHKLEFVEQLMSDFPRMKFILLGDDGQKDPATYARLTRMFPGRILAIGIRQLSRKEAGLSQKFQAPSGATEDLLAEVPIFYGPTGISLMKSMLPYLQKYVEERDK